MKLIKSFIQGIMNKDLDERLIPDGQYRDALNVEVSASEGAGVGAVENMLGNTNVSSQGFTASAKVIGAIADEANDNIYWFVTDTSFDYVMRYNEVLNTTTVLLKDTKDRVLKFDANYLITGVNFINNLLFWTDNLNPPRRLNTATYYALNDFIEDDISVILKAPPKAILITLGNTPTTTGSGGAPFQTGAENNMEDKFLQFACRYKYENDEYSSLSPFSSTAFFPSPFAYNYGDGEFTSMVNKYNQVTLSTYIEGALSGGAWVPDERISEVQLIFRDTRQLNIYIIESFKIGNLPAALSVTGYFDYNFSNNKIYTILAPDEITRLFDNVPLKAKAQELIGSRIAYGNYVQFYDISSASGVAIEINYSLELQSSSPVSTVTPTFRSDRDYEIGIVYLDAERRMTTVLVAPNNTLYIPPANSQTANDIQVIVNNPPPAFATHYRFFIKQLNGDYYNVFPNFFLIQGDNRYFYINPSEKDKIKVGDYIIAKTINGSATLSNTQYKILELESKDQDTFYTFGGLYFKILDPTNTFPTSLIYTFTSNNIGVSSLTYQGGVTGSEDFIRAFGLRSSIVEYPIYYGTQSAPQGNMIADYIPSSTPTDDERIKIIIDGELTGTAGVDTFEVQYWDGTGYATDSTGNDINLAGNVITKGGVAKCIITFGIATGHTSTVDYWIVNIHSAAGNNCIGGPQSIETKWDWHFGYAIVNGKKSLDWAENSTSEIQPNVQTQDVRISAGARISMKLVNRKATTGNSPDIFNTDVTDFPAVQRDYANIEEWFYESGAWDQLNYHNSAGVDVGARNVFFKRGINTTIAGADLRFNTTLTGDNPNPETNFVYQRDSTGNVPAGWASWREYLALKAPIRMFIRSADPSYYQTGGGAAQINPGGLNIFHRSSLAVDFKIVQGSSATVFETIPTENDVEIYHELTPTLDISGGVHKSNISTADDQVLNGQGATISLNRSVPNTTIAIPTTSDIENSNFNAYCFGNGVEAHRIRADWNAATLKYSPRVSSVIEEYKQQRVEEAITYSGIYRENTGINNLNEFNLSLANFKYLDKFFGSIQKLHARDTDVVAFQENKVSKVLYGKNLLSDAVGGGAVTSVPEVLGTQLTYTGEYGISGNPESFAKWGNDMYFTDTRRGAVMKLGLNGMFEISSQGMRDWFKDLFTTAHNTQKIGAIDPFKERYVLATNDTLAPPCHFSIDFFLTDDSTIPSDLDTPFQIGSGTVYIYATISSNTQWTVTPVNTGDNTDWVRINGVAGIYTGENNENVELFFTANGGGDRGMDITFAGCGTTTTYTVFQSRGPQISVEVWMIGNPQDDGLIATQKYDFTSNAGADIEFTDTRMTGEEVSLQNTYTNFAAKESVPAPTDTVSIKADQAGTDTQKPFEPNLGNKMRYLVSNTKYNAEDITALLAASTNVVPALGVGVWTGTFTYSRPSDEAYLYLIWDYRNDVTAGDTITMPTGNSGTSYTKIDYGTRRGLVSLSYNANTTNDTFSLKSGDTIVATTGSVTGAGTLTYLKNSTSPSELVLVVETAGVDDGWSVVTSATTLTSFLIDLNNDDLSTVCARTPATTYYHTGSAALPVQGDSIYTSAAGEAQYDGADYLHKVGAGDDYVSVNSSGMVTAIGSCAACAEVAVPVITLPAFTLIQGQSVSLQIVVTNNPTEWAVVTTCIMYSLEGGAKGANFSTTDCTTGDTISTVVSANRTTTICSTSAPTVTSGTGTSSSLGTCNDEVFPAGLEINRNTGQITGSPLVTGVYSVSLTATNCFGTSVTSTTVITINPPTDNKRFNMDTANPTTSSALACAVTPAFGIMYSTGLGDYPVVNDYIFTFCNCEEQPYNGGYLWYVTDELTVGKNNVIRIDSTGQVVDKVVCP